jgi:O-antigen/teichoic acid export membrane protein
VIGPAYNASQNGKLFNYWAMAGNLAGLLALVAVTQTQGGLVWLVVATSGIGLLVQAMSGIWLFVRAVPAMAPRLRSIRRASAGALLGVGVQFILIQILALMVFEKDNLMVAHYLGAERVAPYSLTYSLFGLTSLIQTILFRYVWVAYSEAIARRDIDWVRRTFFMNFAFSLGSTAVAVVPLVFIARPFIKLWAGEAVVPPFDLVVWMAAWSMINAFCSPIACLQAAASYMKVQIAYSAVSAVVNVALSVYLVQRWGITGVIAATVISYALFICIPALFDVSLLIKKLRRTA